MNTKRGKLFISLLVIAVISVFSSTIYAYSNITTTFNRLSKYIIAINDETVYIPSIVEFSNGVQIKLESFHDQLKGLKGVNYNDGQISISGYSSTPLSSNDEFSGNLNSNGTYKTLTVDQQRRLFYVNSLLKQRRTKLADAQEKLKTATDQNLIDQYTAITTHYAEDIEVFSKVSTSDIPRTAKMYEVIPFLYQKYPVSTNIGLVNHDVNETINVEYYIYGIVHRDLRLSQMTYSVNGSESKVVKDFDPDKHTYNIYLPSTTPKNARITTSSTVKNGSYYKRDGISLEDLDMAINEIDVTLNNGEAQAYLTVTFDPKNYPNNKYNKVVTETYLVNFSVDPYEKGDVDMNGIVNVVDAGLVMDYFKGTVGLTAMQIYLGDMDDNAILNVEDAGKILDKFKGLI